MPMRSILIRASAVVIAMLLLPDATMAAQVGPTDVLRLAFAALQRRDWPALAGHIDSLALESLRQESIGMLILTTEQRLAGEEVGGGYNPYDVVISDHLPRIGSERALGFPGEPTIAQLASLSPSEFFVRWCEAVYGDSTQEDPVREVVELTRRIIGEIREGDDRAHVLYRRESRHVEMGELKVNLPGRVMTMPLRNIAGQWRLRLNDDLGWSIDFGPVLRWDSLRPAIPPVIRPAAVPPNEPAPRTERVEAQPGPDEIAQGAFAAFEAQDWGSMAALVHEQRLASFQRQQISYLVAWSQSRDARADALRQGISVFMYSYDDSLPPEALAQVADLKIPVFTPPRTIGDLAALAPTVFFEAWCEAAYGGETEGIGRWRRESRRLVIGHVFEGDAMAHVLYRLGSTEQGPARRMPLMWSSAGWRLLLNDDIGWQGDLDFRLDRR